MSIEELTKSQLILLALLVSFVTSIATGIVTVSLLDQAPPTITKTINRVVERTVERVVPDGQSASIITKEVTVVVREEDLITDSIEKNASKLVPVFRSKDDSTFLGLGFFLNERGTFVTDGSFITPGEDYFVRLDNVSYKMTVLEEVEALAFLVFHEGEKKVEFSPVTLADLSTVKLGQTVISLTGRERTDVSIGIISGVVGAETPARLNTTIDTRNILLGSPLINMFGEVVGIQTNAHNDYVPVNLSLISEEEAPANE